jgi:hypothetical protein
MLNAVVLLLAASAAEPEFTVIAAPRPWHVRPVPDQLLATMRGGMRLPNGLDLTLGIDLQTRVDGQLVLHTTYASEGAAQGIRVFYDGGADVQTPPATQTVATGATPGTPVLIVDRSPTGSTLVPTASAPATTVNLVSGDQSTWLNGVGQIEVPLTADGQSVRAGPGDYSLAQSEAGTAVVLKSDDYEVQHLIGEATGVVLANTGSDRSIDTVSSINVDIARLPTSLLASGFAAQRAALEWVLAR